MSLPKVHDGEAVRAALKSAGMPVREFGEALGNTNIYNWLRKKHWPTDMLFRAGEVLGVDFFEAYRTRELVDLGRPFIGFILPVEAMDKESMGGWVRQARKGTKEKTVSVRIKVESEKVRQNNEQLNI